MRSVAILAGGRATRFGGRDKSTLLVAGLPIRERQLQALAPLTTDLLIVARDVTPGPLPGRTVAAIRFVRDIVPGCGPLGGLHTALTEARGNAVLVIACDMPFVTMAFADYLFTLAAHAPIVVPRTERGYHPLCAVYTRACLEPIAALLAQRRLAVRALLAAVPARVVTEEEMSRFGAPSRLLANVNTPAEYADLEALQGHKL